MPQQGYDQWQEQGYGGQSQEQPPAQGQGAPDHGGQQYRY